MQPVSGSNGMAYISDWFMWSPPRVSGHRQGSVTYRLDGRTQLDFDVVPEAIQAFHQLAFRKVGEISAHEPGDLRL